MALELAVQGIAKDGEVGCEYRLEVGALSLVALM
jgi:hypothetical protein